MQSRRMSLIEQFANIGSGFVISSLLWHFVIQPWWNIETSVAENLQITALFEARIARAEREKMIDNEAVTGALDAISDAINSQLNAIDVNYHGTVLANLTISLVRACEKLLTDDSFDELIACLEDDDEEVLH